MADKKIPIYLGTIFDNEWRATVERERLAEVAAKAATVKPLSSVNATTDATLTPGEEFSALNPGARLAFVLVKSGWRKALREA